MSTDSPTVYVRSRVISDVRLDLPFIFNMGAVRENMTARGEFLALFRPDSVIEGSVSPRPQPWTEESAGRVGRMSTSPPAWTLSGRGRVTESDESEPAEDDDAAI